MLHENVGCCPGTESYQKLGAQLGLRVNRWVSVK